MSRGASNIAIEQNASHTVSDVTTEAIRPLSAPCTNPGAFRTTYTRRSTTFGYLRTNRKLTVLAASKSRDRGQDCKRKRGQLWIRIDSSARIARKSARSAKTTVNG